MNRVRESNPEVKLRLGFLPKLAVTQPLASKIPPNHFRVSPKTRPRQILFFFQLNHSSIGAQNHTSFKSQDVFLSNIDDAASGTEICDFLCEERSCFIPRASKYSKAKLKQCEEESFNAKEESKRLVQANNDMKKLNKDLSKSNKALMRQVEDLTKEAEDLGTEAAKVDTAKLVEENSELKKKVGELKRPDHDTRANPRHPPIAPRRHIDPYEPAHARDWNK
ncbi:hypothetical protein EJ08DRAFT_680741 [Tothia fuscella]|uniref:Uncharacterized protein n=1 Tax=Tothia fuscella TaxID=1048955 RepID=A0A9P4NN64_9PEZI|nr:hypothetical protein EJ08DRAFT_680741 [Tothia fuscella]